MQENRVIRFFHTVLNPSIMGYEIYTYVYFTLHNISPEKERSFLSYLKAHPQITYVVKTSGKLDYGITIIAKNLKEFDNILSQIRMKFSEIIKDYDTASIIQEYKYDYMVDLIK